MQQHSNSPVWRSSRSSSSTWSTVNAAGSRTASAAAALLVVRFEGSGAHSACSNEQKQCAGRADCVCVPCCCPVHRIALVAAFLVTPFGAAERTWKPFNPVLGETFEADKLHNDAFFVAEQVRTDRSARCIALQLCAAASTCAWCARPRTACA